MAGRRQSCSKALTRNGGPDRTDFMKAQNGICALCGNRIRNLKKSSFDHVVTHSGGGAVNGNVLLTHDTCNNKRQSTPPHPIYVEILEIVNKKLGWDGKVYHNSSNRSAFMRERIVMTIMRRLKVNTRYHNRGVYTLVECRHNHGRVLMVLAKFFINPRFVFEDRLKFMHDGLRF